MPPNNSKRGLGGMEAFETEKPQDYSNVGKGLPKEYLSFSQITLFLQCGKAYEYRYVLDAKSPSSPALVQGKSIHAALETNYGQKIASKIDLPVADILDSFSTEFDEGCKELEDKSDTTNTTMGRLKDDSTTFLGKYHKTYAPSVQPLAVEQEFKLALTPTLNLIGYIDLIQQESAPIPVVESMIEKRAEIEAGPNRDKIIVDHKVTTRKKSQSDTDTSLQLSIYSAATGIKNVRFDSLIVSAKEGEKREQKVVQTISHRTDGDIDFDKSVILSVAQAISSGIFPKTGKGTWMCSQKFCPHFKRCHGERV